MKKLYCCFVISLFLAIPCAAQVIIVDANGTADYPTIQAAINAANTGDIIELQQGTYTGIGNHDIDFLGKAITVRSTNPQDPCVVASTIIDCQRAGRGFYFHCGEDTNSILDGLKITNGYVTVSSPGGSNGGGICCTNQSGPTIANCDISGNTAVGNEGFTGGPPESQARGGGIYGCNGTITNCKINGNTTTGGGLVPPSCGGGLYECSGSITNCIISGNKAYAGTMSGSRGGGLYACDGSITNCTISGNSAVFGGGLGECNGTIINCSINGNTATHYALNPGHGGGIYGCNGTIINCSISGNFAAFGGGLYSCNGKIANCIISGNTAYDAELGYFLGGGGLYKCDGTITNCTISGNSAVWTGGPLGSCYGGGLYDCGAYITNSIIWGNLADIGPELYNSSEPNFSCIKDWIGGGIGNIDDDPCFADPCNGDYHLRSQAGRWDTNSESWMIDDVTSPCIDAGDPLNPIGLEPFPNGGLVNMGAYGGSLEASKSYFDKPVCETIVAGDINGDCIVNFKDFALLTSHWLEDSSPLLPGQASNPDPANYALGVGPNTDLFWTAGSHTSSHYVYFGTANPPAFIGNQADVTFDPGTMDYSTTYYWRIDEVNSTGITTGTLWRFTTQSSPPP